MRIIAGRYKGRTITAPDTMDTRPITDRAKTVLFDMLGHRLALPGKLPPLAVLDLFAGSGALGLEALSRGGRYCLFVEQIRPIAEVLRRNLDTLEIITEADLVQADATRAMFKPPPAESSPGTPADTPDGQEETAPVRGAPDPGDLERAGRQYELVFCDPPYRMLKGSRPAAALRDLLARLAYEPVIARDALIVVRHGVQGQAEPDLSPLVEYERRDVGTMLFRFMVRPGANY